MRPLLSCGLLVLLVATARAICPHAWREWKGFCYRLTQATVPWHGVRGECKTSYRSADVASVTSMAENNMIKGLAGRRSVWLGMRSVNNLQTWIDGTAVRFRNFDGGQAQTNGAEDVVQMEPSGRWRFAISHTAGALRGVCKMRTCRCRSGWRRWGRQCYRAVTARLSWTVASRRCRQLEPTAYLTSIKSGSENNFVFGFLRRYPFWIGFSDRAHEGHFACDSGEECRWYSRWHPPTEPNGVRHREDCAEMLQDRTWADNSCHLGYRAPAFPSVCEYSICGRSKTIPLETVRGTKIRLWQPDDGLRCPPGWRRSDSRCYGGFTAPDTFARVERQCASRHPQATVAVLRSIENNDVAVFAAGSLPMWIDYGRRSGGVVLSGTGQRKQWTSAFTYWEADAEPSPSSKTDCAGMQRSGEWRPYRCDVDQLPGLCEIPACKPTCPSGWVPFEGHCYRLVRRRLSRKAAASVCQRDGGHLASIQSQDENDFIATLAFRRGTDFRKRINRHAWIGAARAHPTDAWTWDDCDAWTMTRWMHVDDSKHTKGVCSAIHCNGRWRQDANCETSMFGSVCELDPCLKNFGPTVPVRSGCRKGKVTEVGSGSWPESQTCL